MLITPGGLESWRWDREPVKVRSSIDPVLLCRDDEDCVCRAIQVLSATRQLLQLRSGNA